MDSPREEALFGRWLRKRRKSLDLTQKALARQVGCSPATIRKLEADERHPSRHVARALAEALGVPEGERDAFVRFARGGWADRPPAGALQDFERPWLEGSVRPSVGVAPPSTRHPPEPGPSPTARVPDAPQEIPDPPRVLARDAELGRLDRELAEALEGRGRVALVAGEAGQGKTALMTAFAARAQEAHPDLMVAFGTCNAYTGRGDPFLPFRQVLAELTGEVPAATGLDAFERERAARLLRAAPWAARTLAQRGPHLLDSLVPSQPLRARLERAGVPSPLPPAGAARAQAVMSLAGAPRDDQQALRAETAATLVAIADETPLLLVLDDLHWLDDSSAELLVHLGRVAAGHRLLVIGAFRPADLATRGADHAPGRAVQELARGQAVTLDLDRADGRAFVEAWLDSQANELGEEFRNALWRQTAGQPLFTIELLRAMQERGDLVKAGNERWVTTDSLRWDELPAGIADALAFRVARLDAAARDVLRVASVEGETFTAEVVARALGLEPRQVTGILGGQLDRTHRLVSAVDVTRGPAGLVTRYRFRHNLIQRYVYDAIDPGERAYLHQTIAEVLEDLLGDQGDPVALCLHYELAHAPERAARHHRRAGDQARRAHALDQAIDHYRAALAHWSEPDPLQRAALQRDLGECQWLRLQLEASRKNLDEARAAFEDAGELRAAGSALLILARLAMHVDDFAAAFDAARRAIAMLEPLGESPQLADAVTTLGYLHILVAEFSEASASGERVMAMAERVGTGGVLALATLCIGSAIPHLEPPRHEEGVALLDRAFHLADEAGLAFEACVAAHNAADVLMGIGRHQEAVARVVAGTEYAKRHQIAGLSHDGDNLLWWLAWLHGDWTAAFERLSRVRGLVDGTQLDFPVPHLAIILATVELDLGRVQEARTILERNAQALHRLVRPAERILSFGVRLRTAVCEGERDEAERSAAAIADAIDPEPPIEYDITVAALDALRHLTGSSADGVAERAATCHHALERLEAHYGSPEAKAALAEGRALQLEAGGAPAESATRWTEAADLWRTGSFPLREARARAAAAQAFRDAGRHEEAGVQAARARLLFSTLAEQIPSGEERDSFASVVERALAEGGSRTVSS